MDDTLNIVVAGKSGVGKSSFLNYLLGKEVFQTGVGEPVTKTYFDRREMPANDQGVKYVLYDTKGIEPTTTKECIENIIIEIDKRDKKSNFFEWIHSVYYCFDCTSARVEPLEYNFINELAKKVSVIVLLTKSDTVNQDKIEALSKEIQKRTSPSVLIIPVCSVESKGTRRNPTPRHQFGREEVLKSSFYGLWNKVATIIPRNSVKEIQTLLDKIQPLEPDDLFLHTLTSIKLDIEKPNIKILNQIEEQLKEISESPSKKVYEKVVNFYKKVNKFTPKIFLPTESQKAFNELKEYKSYTDIDNIKECLKNISSAREELYSCWIFSASEERMLNKEIDDYKNTIEEIKQRIQSKIDNFVNVYTGELRQYGRLCISNEKLESIQFDSLSDLSKDEHLYSELVRFALSNDRAISPDERRLLDKLRIELKISEIKAGKIEDFLRYSEKDQVVFKA